MRDRLAQVGPPRSRADHDFQRVALPADHADIVRDLLMAERAHVVIEVFLPMEVPHCPSARRWPHRKPARIS